MKRCSWIKRLMESDMSDHDRIEFDRHLKDCERCRQEFNELKLLYSRLHDDEVPLPDDRYWETVRQRVRQREVCIGKKPSWVKRLVPIAVPVIALCIALFVFVIRPSQTVEMIIPVAEILEDEDIAALALERMSHEEIVDDFEVIEESLPLDIEEAFSEMTSEEKELFIEFLTQNNGIGI
jgi:hypothetical protein